MVDLTNGKQEKTVEVEEPAPCYACCLASHNPLPESPSLVERLHHALLCPPHGPPALLVTYAIALVTVWAVAYCLLGQVALPGTSTIEVSIHGGTVFSLLALLTVSLIMGWVMEKLHMPPLLGMLLTGIALKNIPYIDVARGVDPEWYAATRSTALVVILLRACLGLSPEALKKLSAMVFRLAFMPCLAESFAVAVAARVLLGLPWQWGFMLGFVLAAVSPAVVVSCLLNLQERGYGVTKGIPTLVIAAASMDDVLAISCFTLLLGANNPKERLFVALAWLPKATVQAAMGPLALDKARQALASYLEDNSGLSCEDIQKEEELLELCNMVNYGTQMLTVAVMAILITAPMGAILIMLTGPRLLAQDVPDDAKEAKEEHKLPGTYEMQELGDADGFSDSPNRVARFKAAQHHGSQQLIAARRFSCL